MDINADKLPSTQQEASTLKSTDSRASRIMSVKDTSPLLVITIFFVFSNILFSAFVNIPLSILLLIFIGITYHHWKNPDHFPGWLTKYSDRIIRRSRVFPAELILFVAILAVGIIQITKPDMSSRWYLFSFCSLVILAFVLTELGNKAAYTGYRGWRIIWELSLKPLFSSKKRKRDESMNQEEIVPLKISDVCHEHITPEEIEVDSSSQSGEEKGLWEEEQKKRWEEWIQEELQRLNGSSLDEPK